MSSLEETNGELKEAKDVEDEDVREEDDVVDREESVPVMADEEENTNVASENVAADKKNKGAAKKPASSRPSTHLDKKAQQMLAELQRLKTQMSENQQSIHKPPIRPYTPDIHNSLSPYYNKYMVNYTIQDLQQGIPAPKGYHHRSTALGVIEPEVSWRMDNFPAPFHQSRLPSRLFHSMAWSRNMGSHDSQSSSRLPPLPMPSFPKFNQPSYQPHQMTYDQLATFRCDVKSIHGRLAEHQAKADYDKTIQDWNRMNLSELKKLPPGRKYHIKKAIMSYMGTSQGSSRALRPLTKELDGTSTEPIVQQ